MVYGRVYDFYAISHMQYTTVYGVYIYQHHTLFLHTEYCFNKPYTVYKSQYTVKIYSIILWSLGIFVSLFQEINTKYQKVSAAPLDPSSSDVFLPAPRYTLNTWE